MAANKKPSGLKNDEKKTPGHSTHPYNPKREANTQKRDESTGLTDEGLGEDIGNSGSSMAQNKPGFPPTRESGAI